jgi:hypothetical protein
MLCAVGLAPLVSPAAADEGDIGKQLESAVDDYIDAAEKLENSKAEQDDIDDEIKDSERKVKKLKKEVSEFGISAYMRGGLPPAMVVLSEMSPERAMESLSLTGYLGEESGSEIQRLIDSKEDLKAQQEALEDEVADAEKAKEKMDSARNEAAEAMAASGGDWGMGPSPGDFPAAEAAPRNPDGSLPQEGCSVTDPTTDGCISPRNLHAMNQAIIAGFTREISCYRSLEDGGDHPRGKACDYTVGSQGGFAQGEARTYGDNCAAWFVENAEALGVKGIIWYNELWTPATGWGPYSGGNTGDPSLDHANHVHVSMR